MRCPWTSTPLIIRFRAILVACVIRFFFAAVFFQFAHFSCRRSRMINRFSPISSPPRRGDQLTEERFIIVRHRRRRKPIDHRLSGRASDTIQRLEILYDVVQFISEIIYCERGIKRNPLRPSQTILLPDHPHLERQQCIPCS